MSRQFKEIMRIDIVISKEIVEDAIKNIYKREDNNEDLKREKFIEFTQLLKEEACKNGRSQKTKDLINNNYCTVIGRYDYIHSGIFKLIVFDLPKEKDKYSIDCDISYDVVTKKYCLDILDESEICN